MKDWNSAIVLSREAGDLLTATPAPISNNHFTAVNAEEDSIRDDNRLRENSEDIQYGDNLVGPYHLPEIQHGSVDRLIERLCDPRLPGADFMETFLLTYRAFTTSKVVLENLIEAYWKVMGGKQSLQMTPKEDRKSVSRTSSMQSFVFNDMSNISLSSVDDETASVDSGLTERTTKSDELTSPTIAIRTTSWCENVVTDNNHNAHPVLHRSASDCTVGDSHNNVTTNHQQLFRSRSTGSSTAKSLQLSHQDTLTPNLTTRKLVLSDIYEPSDLNLQVITNGTDHCNDAADKEDNTTDKFNERINSDGVQKQSEISVDDALTSSTENSKIGEVTPTDIAETEELDKVEESLGERLDSTSSYGDMDMRSSHSSSADNNSIHSLDNTISSSLEYDQNMGSLKSNTSIESTPELNENRKSLMPPDEGLRIKKRSVSESILTLTQDYLGLPDSEQYFKKTNKRHSLSPLFLRKKKESEHKPKKDKATKNRSSSDYKSREPVLINMRDTTTGAVYKRSESMYETTHAQNINSENIDYETKTRSLDRKTLTSTSSLPMPIALPNHVKKSPDLSTTPRRKRSVFNNPFGQFKKGLKRASSEQVINVGSSLAGRDSFVSNLSNSLLNLDERNERKLSSSSNRKLSVGSIDSGVRLSSSLNEKEEPKIPNSVLGRRVSKDDLNIPTSTKNSKLPFNVSIRSDKRKKRFHGSMRHLSIFSSGSKEEKEVKPRRKTSVFEQGRPPPIKHTVSVNRGPLKIMSIFKHWLTKHPKDFVEDPEMISMLEDFFVDIKSDTRTFPVVKEIVGSLEKSLRAYRKSLSAVHPFDELLLKKDLQEVENDEDDSDKEEAEEKELQQFSYYVVAENMTLLEHYLYAKISFNEFISCQWTRKDKEEKAPGIMKFIKRFNQEKGTSQDVDVKNEVTKIISYYVVHGETPDKRASLIEFWIRVAAHCRDLNNFNAIMEIISALNASSVRRLKKSWELVSKAMREVFTDLESLVSADRSFKNLRAAVHMCNPPCVPYLGSYLSDLLFVHEGGKTFNDNGLVNYAKMCRISKLVREVKCYQQLPYTLDFNLEVGTSLVAFDKDVDEDSLYEHSLLVEPRASS